MSRNRTVSVLIILVAGLLPTLTRPAEPAPLKVTRLTQSHWPKLFLSYSPDGSHLVYSRHYPNRRAANLILTGLRIVRADGTEDRPFLPAEYDARVQIQEHPFWSRDGRTLYLTGGGNDTGNGAKDAFRCEVDLAFKASNLRKVVPGDGVNLGEQPVLSPDGYSLVTSTGRDLWISDADGKNRRSLLRTAGQYCYQPAWSPDGEWIAFSSDRDGNPEIYKVRPDGTGLVRLTKSPGIDCRPRWSPDGRWLAFTSNRTGNEDIWLMRADGSELRNLTQHADPDDHAAWRPDGRAIAFVSLRDGGFDIYRLDLPDDIKVDRAPPPAPPLPPPPPGEIMVHYDFDQDEGETVRDRTGRGLTLELNGAKLAGERGRQSLLFGGKNTLATAGNPKPLQIDGPLTVSLWVRPEKQTSNGYLISKHGWNVYLTTDLVPQFETRDAADKQWETLPARVPLLVGQWSMVTAVFDPQGKVLLIYVNGLLAGSKPRMDGRIGAVAGYPLELGVYNASRSQWFRGQLDEVRVYKRAIGADEIIEEFRKQSGRVLPP